MFNQQPFFLVLIALSLTFVSTTGRAEFSGSSFQCAQCILSCSFQLGSSCRRDCLAKFSGPSSGKSDGEIASEYSGRPMGGQRNTADVPINSSNSLLELQLFQESLAGLFSNPVQAQQDFSQMETLVPPVVSSPPAPKSLEEARFQLLQKECDAGYTPSCNKLSGLAAPNAAQNLANMTNSQHACRDGSTPDCVSLGRLAATNDRYTGPSTPQLEGMLRDDANTLCNWGDDKACDQIDAMADPNVTKNLQNLTDTMNQCAQGNDTSCANLGRLNSLDS